MTISTVADAVDFLVLRDQGIVQVGKRWEINGEQVSGKELLQLARRLDGSDDTPKYGNVKGECDGVTFDSLAEMRHYQELKLRQEAGEISDLELQPRFPIVEAFRDWSGKRHEARYYVADFQYRCEGRIIVEDVKGARTDVYMLKRALFLSQYRHIEFREIDV